MPPETVVTQPPPIIMDESALEARQDEESINQSGNVLAVLLSPIGLLGSLVNVVVTLVVGLLTGNLNALNGNTVAVGGGDSEVGSAIATSNHNSQDSGVLGHLLGGSGGVLGNLIGGGILNPTYVLTGDANGDGPGTTNHNVNIGNGRMRNRHKRRGAGHHH